MWVAIDERGRMKATMFQRSPGRIGARLGVSTGWSLRGQLKKHGVAAIAGCTYKQIDAQGLHYSVGGTERLATVDTIVICAGQNSAQQLAGDLERCG